MQRTGRDPGVRGLDGTPLPTGFPGDLRPFGAQFPACGKHDILGEMLDQLCPSARCPVALQRPPLQLRKTHKRDAGKAAANVAAIPSRTGIALKEHRHDIRVNDSGIHREGAGAEPSWRHARSMAEKSSTDSSSADGCPSRVSNSVTGQTPCDAASSSNEGVSEFRLIALLVSLSTVSG